MLIKAAFLQGEDITRDIFIVPPQESEVTAGHIWKLCKVVYGLNDASRNWYFSVRKTLLSLNCKISIYDKAIFRWYENGTLAGL